MKNGKAFLSELENIYTALMSFFFLKNDVDSTFW